MAPDLPVTSARRDVPDLPQSVALSTKDLYLISSTFLLSFYFPIKTLFVFVFGLRYRGIIITIEAE